MRRYEVTPLSEINRRAPEAGRIRLGHKVPVAGKPGKTVMKALDKFRFTSPNQEVIRQLSILYGGDVRPWHDPKANPSNQFEVYSDVNEMRVWLTTDGISTQYELWSGGGAQRRCNGVTVQIPQRVEDDYELVDSPCICNAQKRLECKAYTRLQVIIPEVNFIGVWRLESKGWNAAEELPGMYDFIQSQAQQGKLVEARLGVEKRERVTPRGKSNFVVPRLWVAQSLDELAVGTPRAALTEGTPRAALPAAPIDEGIADAELIDDEELELTGKLEADALNFGLDPKVYSASVWSSTNGDRERIKACIEAVRVGRIEPTGFDQGRVVWRRIDTPERTSE